MDETDRVEAYIAVVRLKELYDKAVSGDWEAAEEFLKRHEPKIEAPAPPKPPYEIIDDSKGYICNE